MAENTYLPTELKARVEELVACIGVTNITDQKDSFLRLSKSTKLFQEISELLAVIDNPGFKEKFYASQKLIFVLIQQTAQDFLTAQEGPNLLDLFERAKAQSSSEREPRQDQPLVQSTVNSAFTYRTSGHLICPECACEDILFEVDPPGECTARTAAIYQCVNCGASGTFLLPPEIAIEIRGKYQPLIFKIGQDKLDKLKQPVFAERAIAGPANTAAPVNPPASASPEPEPEPPKKKRGRPRKNTPAPEKPPQDAEKPLQEASPATGEGFQVANKMAEQQVAAARSIPSILEEALAAVVPEPEPGLVLADNNSFGVPNFPEPDNTPPDTLAAQAFALDAQKAVSVVEPAPENPAVVIGGAPAKIFDPCRDLPGYSQVRINQEILLLELKDQVSQWPKDKLIQEYEALTGDIFTDNLSQELLIQEISSRVAGCVS